MKLPDFGQLSLKRSVPSPQNTPSKINPPEQAQRESGTPKGLFDRLRERIDRYRDAGRERREHLEELLDRRRPHATPPDGERPLIPEVPTGAARSPLSAQDFEELEKRITYTIKHRGYFLQAVTHRSYLQFSQHSVQESNERLEFLGDSILNLVVAEYLYREFQNLPEGDLTKLRSRLVSGAALVHHAMLINLEHFLLLSSSAESALKRGSATLLADAYEALIAAIYLDGGMDAARDFIYRHIITHTRRDELMLSDTNYKSMLLEFVQSKKLPSPRYVLVSEDGPNHDRTFSVEVLVENTSHGGGTGRSKKEAEQKAAHVALEKLGVLSAPTSQVQ